jgi:hypothetical protein
VGCILSPLHDWRDSPEKLIRGFPTSGGRRFAEKLVRRFSQDPGRKKKKVRSSMRGSPELLTGDLG